MKKSLFRKLLTGFLSVVLVWLIGTGLMLAIEKQNINIIRKIDQTLLPLVLQTADMNFNAANRVADFKGFILTGNEKLYEQFVITGKLNDTIQIQLIENEVNETGRNLVQEAQWNEDRYEKIAEKAILLKREGKDREALQVMENEAMVQAKIITDQLREFQKFRANQINDAFAMIIANQVKAQWLGLLFAGGFLVVGCCIGLYTARSILRPLTNLTEAAREIAEGNIGKKIAVSSEDEVGQLSVAFNTMSEQLQKMMSNLQVLNDQLEHRVLERTAELTAANEMLNAQSEELTAMNEELTAMNEEISAMNESLQDANRKLDAEMVIRQQKEQEVLSREKQYRATTVLLTHSDEGFDALLETILRNAIQLVGAPGGHIGLKEDDGRNYIIRHTTGNYPAKHLLQRFIDKGMLGEVFASGETVYVEDYRQYPHRVQDKHFDRLRTVIMVPLKSEREVKGVLAADWTDEVHLVTEEDLEILRQFGVLASIALERTLTKQQIVYQNDLLKKLAETTSSLVNELDLDKVLQNILEQATTFMEIPHGFISLFESDERQARIKCGLGRYEKRVGTVTRFDGKGLYAEILRTGKMAIVEDYANWPQRLEGVFTAEMTASMQAPLNVDGKTVASIGLAAYGEPFKIDQTKLAVFEQFATIAAIAVKNAMAHQKTNHQALHDTLTSLPNRAFLNKRLEEELQKTRGGETVGAVLYIDLDDLKTVNDSFGHSCGDGVIKAAASQIADTVGPKAFVARVGGDEFIVILSGEDDLKNIAQIANRLVSASHREYEVGGRNIHMSVSVGVTLYPGDGEIVEALLKNADSAMYAAKAAGRNCWRFFEPEMLKEAYGKWSLTQSLRHALERKELYLHYQPLIKLDSMEIIGFEALLRWNSSEHGMVSPVRFIPLAESSGLILPIGQWVLSEACRFAHELADMGRENVHVAVNISPRQLASEDFVEMVRLTMDETGIQPKQLEVEITENVLIDSLEDSIRKLGKLNAMGVGLSLDDFGTGFSSLTYLRSLPMHTLKIDKSFIDGITVDTVQEDFVRSIIDMAHAIGLNVVAEGVESEVQLQKLALFGCDCVQGYIFSRPVSGEEALRFSI